MSYLRTNRTSNHNRTFRLALFHLALAHHSTFETHFPICALHFFFRIRQKLVQPRISKIKLFHPCILSPSPQNQLSCTGTSLHGCHPAGAISALCLQSLHLTISGCGGAVLTTASAQFNAQSHALLFTVSITDSGPFGFTGLRASRPDSTNALLIVSSLIVPPHYQFLFLPFHIWCPVNVRKHQFLSASVAVNIIVLHGLFAVRAFIPSIPVPLPSRPQNTLRNFFFWLCGRQILNLLPYLAVLNQCRLTCTPSLHCRQCINRLCSADKVIHPAHLPFPPHTNCKTSVR